MADHPSRSSHPARAEHAERPAHQEEHDKKEHEKNGHDHAKGEEERNDETMSTRSTIVLFIGIIVIVACFSAMVYFGIQLAKPRPQERDFNNYHFTQDLGTAKGQSIWWTQVQKGQTPFNLPFMTPPWEVEDITVPRSSLDFIFRAEVNPELRRMVHVYMSVYVNSTGTAVVGATNVARVLGTKYGIYNFNVSSGLDAPTASGSQVITCANSSTTNFVIFITKADVTKVSVEGPSRTCVVLQATNSTDLLRVTDAYTYYLLGIMKATS